VLCVNTPWSNEALEIHVTNFARAFAESAQRHRPPLIRANPWALELANGERCVLVAGIPVFVAGQQVDYDCGRPIKLPPELAYIHPPGDGWVIGSVDRAKEPWTVSYTGVGSVEAIEVRVRRAWF
jgi:hypothetical protein